MPSEEEKRRLKRKREQKHQRKLQRLHSDKDLPRDLPSKMSEINRIKKMGRMLETTEKMDTVRTMGTCLSTEGRRAMTRTFKKMPTEAFRLTGEIVQAAEGEYNLSMIANSGQVFDHGVFGPTIVDMASMSIPNGNVNILREHRPECVVGFGPATIGPDNRLHVMGKTSRVTRDGIEVAGLLTEGQPLQASVYIPCRLEMISPKSGAIEVNGMKLSGPLTIFRDSILREASVCVLGMDPNTTTSAFANTHGDTLTVECETEVEDTESTEEDSKNKETNMAEITEETKPVPVAEVVPAVEPVVAVTETETLSVAVIDDGFILKERARCKDIMLAAEALGLKSMGLTLIDAGMDVKDAKLALQARRLEMLSVPSGEVPAPNGEPSTDRPKPKGETEKLTFASVDEEVEHRWMNEVQLHDDFLQKSHFAAWLRHEKMLESHPNSKRNKGEE